MRTIRAVGIGRSSLWLAVSARGGGREQLQGPTRPGSLRTEASLSPTRDSPSIGRSRSVVLAAFLARERGQSQVPMRPGGLQTDEDSSVLASRDSTSDGENNSCKCY